MGIISIKDRWGDSHYINREELTNNKTYVYLLSRSGKRISDKNGYQKTADRWIHKDNLVSD